MKKYKLTDETTIALGVTLYRIEALIDFADVKKGDKGGFVESEENLSQNGDCWVYGDAKVFDRAKVFEDAKVYSKAEVYGDAEVYGKARVDNKARVFGNAFVFSYAEVCDYAIVCEDAVVHGHAAVFGEATIGDSARVCGEAEVYGNSEICDNAYVGDNAEICGNTKVFGDAGVFGDADIYGDAEICGQSDYIVFKNWWSSGRYFTWTRSNNKWKVGDFYGTGEELIRKAYADSKMSGKEYERIVKYVESILNYKATTSTQMSLLPLWVSVLAQTTLH